MGLTQLPQIGVDIPVQDDPPTSPELHDLWIDSDADCGGGTGVSTPWTPFTPTWTNLTVGNGVLTAAYTQSGKTVNYWVKLVFGTTTTVGAAVVTYSLPVAALAANHVAAALYHESGVNPRCGTTFPNSTAVAGLVHATAWVATTSPFTWGTADEIYTTGIYESA